MIEPSTLVAGSAVALIAGFWNQAKTLFGYLASFLVVTTHVDDVTAVALRVYLKSKYKTLPSGLLHFKSIYFCNVTCNKSGNIPFQALNSYTVFYSGWRMLIANQPEQTPSMVLTSIRGTINYTDLVSKALDFYEHLLSDVDSVDRFYIQKVVGSEKGISGSGQSGRTSEDIDERAAHPIVLNNDNNSKAMPVDPLVEKSFRYERHTYQNTYSAKGPFDGLYFPAEITSYIAQAEQWIEMRSWYEERNIPWRRGWMLHGPGGTGKSSLAKAIAQQLGIPVYQYFLATLSDQEFLRTWDNMSAPCMVLFEDFDTVFDKRESLTEHKMLTFDCVLNQISGVSSRNGIFLIITTNHVEKIDEAMGVSCGRNGISTRPGRIDTVIEVGLINRENREKMAARILKDWPEIIPALVDAGEGTTPIQFQEMILQEAFAKLS